MSPISENIFNGLNVFVGYRSYLYKSGRALHLFQKWTVFSSDMRSHQHPLELANGLVLDRLAVDLADLVAHVQRRLSMDHAAVHNPCHNTPAILCHLERDAHRFVRVLLELDQSHAGHVLQLAIVHRVDIVTVEIRRNGWRRHP